MREKPNLDDIFCIRRRQSWKKDLERFRLNTGKMPPPLPRFNVGYANAFNSLPKCPNIEWWGEGKDKSQLDMFRFILKSVHVIQNLCHIIALRL